MSEFLERRAALTGIGQSDVGRRLNRDPLALTADACLAAIEDAGLRREDIDGLSTYPGNMGGAPAGFSGAGITEVQDMLRLDLDWFCGGPELPGQLGSVVNACMAVATGLARHVLCFRTVWESTAQGSGGRQGIGAGGGGRFRAGGFMQWTLPYGAASAAVLDRHDGEAPLPRVRHHARAAGLDRPQRAPQRGPEPEGHLPRPDDDGRLPVGPHDLGALLPVRLRRARGRRHGDDRLPRRRRQGPAPAAAARRGGGHGHQGPSLLGPVGRPHHHGPARRRGDALEAHRPRPPPTSTARSSTTASASSPWPGSRRWASAARGEGGPFSRAASASPSRASCPSTRTAASSPAADCTATASSTRRACSCGARAARARWRATRRWPSPRPAAARSAAACC